MQNQRQRRAVNRQVRLKYRPQGIPDTRHFEIVETPIPQIADGQALVQNIYLSVDPAMRGWVSAEANYADPVPIGDVMRSFAVGKVVASRHPGYAVDDIVTGMFGWQDYVCADSSLIERTVQETGIPVSAALGVLGLTGLTAYFALLDIGRPKAGEVVVVSSAAGAVGSCAGQIAKIKGCRTVAIAGGEKKRRLCMDAFGYDAAIDYRSDDLDRQMASACPDGVDVYFDNTSGPISDSVMKHLNIGARVIICGTISVATWNPLPLGPRVERHLLVKRASMRGFLCSDHTAHFAQARRILSEWIKQGRISYREEVLSGLEKAPGAIAGLYRGDNLGKRLIQISS